jgi:hypothetical protein
VANEYATSSELKATLSLGSETFADADITLALTGASRAIDKLCNRRFYADADVSQVRYYTPDDRRCLRIDDLVTLTSLTVDSNGDGTYEQTWTLNTDFVLKPLNAAADSEPWREIEIHPLGSYCFPCHLPRSVKVTGKFGWAAVPDAIKAATMMLSARLIKRAREAPFGVAGFGMDGAVVSIARNDPDVVGLVKPYMRGRVTIG